MHDHSDFIALTEAEEREAHAREITRRYVPRRRPRRFAVPFAAAIAIHIFVLGGGWWLANKYLATMARPPAARSTRGLSTGWSLMAPADGSVYAVPAGENEFLAPEWAQARRVELDVAPTIAPTAAWPADGIRARRAGP